MNLSNTLIKGIMVFFAIQSLFNGGSLGIFVGITLLIAVFMLINRDTTISILESNLLFFQMMHSEEVQDE